MARIFIRSQLIRVVVTHLADDSDPDAGAVRLCPRLCWAADFEEFERLEIHNLTRCARFVGHVRFGREGEVCVPSTASLVTQVGDTLRITAWCWSDVAAPAATRAMAGRNNQLFEIRRIDARPLTQDPSFIPLESPRETIRFSHDFVPFEATD